MLLLCGCVSVGWAGWILRTKMVAVACELLTLRVGARLWLLRAALLETWVMVDKDSSPAGLAASQLAL